MPQKFLRADIIWELIRFPIHQAELVAFDHGEHLIFLRLPVAKLQCDCISRVMLVSFFHHLIVVVHINRI